MRIQNLIRQFIGTFLLSALIAGTAFADIEFNTTVEINDDVVYGSSGSSGSSSSSSYCDDVDSELAETLGCTDDSEEVFDFTKFEGEFEPPDPAGYDESLTENDNARDLIVTIVKFVLSFLGIIAVIMVIYAGILYVTSRGDGDQVENAKKTITYAVIGIVIIMSSYALINTIFQATDPSGPDNLADNNGTIGESGAAFDVDAALGELGDITEEFLTAYDTLLFINSEVQTLQAIEVPTIVDMGALIQGLSIWDLMVVMEDPEATGRDPDDYAIIDPEDIDSYLNEIENGLLNIQSEVDPLSNTYQIVQTLLNYIQVQNISEGPHPLKALFEGLIPVASADGGGCSARTYQNLASQAETSFENSVVYDTEVELVDDYICSGLDMILEEAMVDYQESLSSLIVQVQTLASLFESESSASTLTDIGNAFDQLVTLLNQAGTQINNTTARNFIEAIDQLYVLVENIEFVSAQIEASVVRGNAPLIVRFDALGSTDPTGQTITSAQYEWDLDGDGQFDDATGPTTNYKYEEPGTYQVSVRISSSDDNVAAGLARLVIIVEPAISVLYIEAQTQEDETVIADYTQFPVYTVENYKVTMTEAEGGITFDASQSTAGDGGALVSYEWDFGDGDVLQGPTESTVSHAFGEAGKYLVTLKVVDSTGVVDQYYFNVWVASPAAKISASQTYGYPGETITFDGENSTTDVGRIVNYEWSLSKENELLTLNNASNSSLAYTFQDPGTYTVTLTVTDGSGKQDTSSIDISIASQPPVVMFSCTSISETQPNTYECDASDSYDPDESDTLENFEWDFEGEAGRDYTVLSQNEDNTEVTVRFNTEGEHDVTLTVTDQHEEDLRQTSTLTKTVTVNSILDIELRLPGDSAYYLNSDGEADVEFSVYSSSATAFEIDYGDGEGDYTTSLVNGYATFTHTYDNAGVFYVTVTAVNDESEQTSITRRIYISSGDLPIAVIEVTAEGQDIGFGETLYGHVGLPFTFDASGSRNVNGLPSNLKYSWNFDDGTTSSQAETTHVFEEQATYEVTLTVTDRNDPELSSQSTVQIVIEGVVPKIRGISVIPQKDDLETPVPVSVQVDAEDEDGRINYMEVWYFDVNEPEEKLDSVISQTLSATLTLQTKGVSGEEVTYGIGVSVVDSDGNEVSSMDVLDSEEWPTLTVVNGPNDSPEASFTVDRPSVMIGDEVTFSSTSFDPDGEIVAYIWDVEGDGFRNNEAQSEPTYTYAFNQVAPDGIEVSLKVIDDVGATAISDPVTIYVDASVDAPTAAFLAEVDEETVVFSNQSTFDTENGAEAQGFFWDFNLDEDSDGDGDSDNDIDSTEENPEITYEAQGVYEVALTVVDNIGQEDTVTQTVRVLETQAPDADFSFDFTHLNVEFTNESEVDEENDVDVRSFEWNFGDGTSSSEENPEHSYSEFGLYTVTLTVTDTQGKSDTISKKIELESPIQPVELGVTTIPAANSKNKIELDSVTGTDIAFFLEASGGSGNFEYIVDRNLFFDTDGNGKSYDDEDYVTEEAGTYTSYFDPAWQPIVVQITVLDRETGESDTVTFQVVFKNWEGGANLFGVTPLHGLALLAVFIGAAGLAAYGLRGAKRPTH